MRHFLIVVVICLGVNLSYGQSKNYIPVAVFKESKTIDSLMDLAMLKRSKTLGDRKDSSDGNCFLLYYYDQVVPKKTFSFIVQENTKEAANEYLNKILKNGARIGYFAYKDERIFVCTGSNLYDFFNRTAELKSFDFFYKLPDTYSYGTGNFLDEWVYRYQDGYFSDKVGPVVVPGSRH